MSANLIIGSSHALQFAAALGKVHAPLETAIEGPVEITAREGKDNHLIFTTARPDFMTLSKGPNGQVITKFGPLIEKIRGFDNPDSTVVFAIGGNEHNINFLRAHPRPFDFYDPAYPGMDASRQIIPAVEMKEKMRSLLERPFFVTRTIAAQVPKAKRYYLPPPPPIPSEEHMRNNSEVFDFRNGVENAGVRLKIYNLYLDLLRAFCQQIGITFLPPVAANCDEHGFLREAYWAGCTHATPDYYAGITQELGL